MLFILEAFFSGCISKVINDGKDYSWSKIKSVIKDRHDQNISTRICRVIEKSLNMVTGNTYKNSDDLYIAIEEIFNEFKNHGDTLESVKCGLKMLGADASDQRCENFLEKFYEGIRRDDDLYKAVMMDLEQRGIKLSQEEFQKLNEKIDNLTEIVSRENDNKINIQKRKSVKSRTQEYADIWNKNMFLNNFNEWDENVGVNVKLSDVYIDKHLPHFKYGDNEKEFDDLDVLLSKHIMKNNENKMLLILGQPGIGKSTLITWITVNFTDRINDILVYRFASDLGNTDWENEKISNRVLEELGLDYSDLDGKILILDGFDEVSIEASRRKGILDRLYGDWIYNKTIDKFSLIVTCRENYVLGFERVKCSYITLQPWDNKQIQSFCDVYHKNTNSKMTENSINNILKKKEVMGIPLILYMTLALNISIEEEGSMVDIYDQIFSLKDGGIYERCIDNSNYAGSHWISEMKMQIHQVSRNIAIWMFEENPDEAYIPQEKYREICMDIIQENKRDNDGIEQNFLIGNFFKLKHCEGIEGEQLYFIHRTIYEYFVAEAICNSIENALANLSEESQEELAGNIAIFLMKGKIDYTIGEFLKNKIYKIYKVLSKEKQEMFSIWWKKTLDKMMVHGMFYFTKKNIQCYENIIGKECQCFRNLLEIIKRLRDFDNVTYTWSYVSLQYLEKYIRYCSFEFSSGGKNKFIDLGYINLEGINLQKVNLNYADLTKTCFKNANLSDSDLQNANLQGTDFRDADLRRADLRRAKLMGTIFEGANLRGANLKELSLGEADLLGAILDENQVKYLGRQCILKGTRIYVFKTKKIVDYEDYCNK